jgi:hypothetical protein
MMRSPSRTGWRVGLCRSMMVSVLPDCWIKVKAAKLLRLQGAQPELFKGMRLTDGVHEGIPHRSRLILGGEAACVVSLLW